MSVGECMQEREYDDVAQAIAYEYLLETTFLGSFWAG